MTISGQRQWVNRQSGINSRLSYNLASVIKKDRTPLSSRQYGVIYLEARVVGFLRLAVLSRNLL